MFHAASSSFRILILMLMLFGSFIATKPQSLTLGIPSTDIQPTESVYIEGDFLSHFDRSEHGGFQTYGPRIVYGVRKNVEIGVNAFYTRHGGSSIAEVQPNIKWKVYSNDKRGVAAAGGMIAFITPNRAAGTYPSAMFYTNASRTFKCAKGIRLTGGIYGVVGGGRKFGTKTGALLGLEQPLTNKLTLLVDWTSGNNRLGYSNAGFGYKINRSQYFGAGYSFGNKGRGNNFLTVFYGLTF